MLVNITILVVCSIVICRYVMLIYLPRQEYVIIKQLVDMPYTVGIYSNPGYDSYMLHFLPQDTHMFIENGSVLYQPDYVDEHQCCRDPHPEIAYILPINNYSSVPKPVCRRKLKYLKREIYTDLIYTTYHKHIINPIVIIKKFIESKFHDVNN